MKTASIALLLLISALCAATKLQPRDDCADCQGFPPDCSCEDYHFCKSQGCDTGECQPHCPDKRWRVMAGELLKRKPNDCPDCRGFPPDCSCEDYFFCKSQGCDTGECQPDCSDNRKRTMAGEMFKRKPDDCADCYGFPPDCSCEDYLICKSQGCDTGECQPNCPAERKRTMLGELLKRKPNDCADCRGFPPDCSCEDYFFCKSQGCDTGECQPDCSDNRKRTMAREMFKRKPDDCADCYGFPPDCSCEDYLICKSQGCDTGECQPNCPAERKRTMLGELLKRKSNDCADCRGFPPDCSCEDYFFCKSQGCDTGECQPDCSDNRKRTMAGELLKRKPDDCADCYGFPPDCSCEDYLICKSQGCDTGECQPNCPAERKRTMLGELLKRKPNDCADCRGFPPDCSCEDYFFCKSQGCDTGECQPDCSENRKRTMAGEMFKRKPDDCADCYGFPPDCSCEDYLICKSQGCDTGECQPDCSG